MEALFGVLVLAVLVEGMVEYFVSKEGVYQPWLKYVSAGIGVVACVAYKVDILAFFGLVSGVPYVGSVLSGLVIGRGSNYLSDFLTRIKALTDKSSI